MTAYECHLRGLEYHRLGGVVDENLHQAIDWFERAIEADRISPDRAPCGSAPAPTFPSSIGTTASGESSAGSELDPNDPEANRVMGAIHMYRGAFDAARQCHEKAMALSPSDAYIKGRSAAFYNFAGEPERALQLLKEAEELDPSCMSGASRSRPPCSTTSDGLAKRSRQPAA